MAVTLPSTKPKLIGDLVGGWGPWQMNVFWFDVSVQILTAAQIMSIAFTAPKVDFECADHEHGIDHDPVNMTLSKCEYLTWNGTKPCTSWTYSTEQFDMTATQEFNLVCDRAYLASVSQSLYIFGYFISSLVSGHLSDTYGRLPVLWVSTILEIFFGIASAFSGSMANFMAMRFLMAAAVYAKFLTAFTLVMEVAGSEHRTTYGSLAR